jgi:hypothetical protein
MSILSDRIHGEQYESMPAYHPSGTAGTPMVAPMAEVTYTGDTVLYGTLHPLVTADGATVPATADVHYPAVVPAGNA